MKCVDVRLLFARGELTDFGISLCQKLSARGGLGGGVFSWQERFAETK